MNSLCIGAVIISGGQTISTSIYPKRGMSFSIQDYSADIQKIWKEKCRSIDEIVAQLPTTFSFGSAFLAAQPRGFLRALGKRKDFQKIECFSAFFLEPYEFLSFPQTQYRTFYFGPIERMLQDVVHKTVEYIPKQYTQIDRCVATYAPEYCIHTATVPDAEGYINLGLNSAADEPYLRESIKNPKRKVIIEINRFVPWVMGDPNLGDHKIHISEVSYLYENHEPLFELPILSANEREQQIAKFACQYIQDGCTLQVGIGGIPNYIATQIGDRKDIGVHTEMLSDWIIELTELGIVTNKRKGYREGVSSCAFLVGTNRLYDWVDHNPKICILPISEVNHPFIVAKCNDFISINASLMVDFAGQACSESIGHRQYSGPGGQFEFVQGAYLAGGRSVLCLKSSADVKGELRSNILPSLPPGASVTVPRFFTDVIVTEYGIAELLHLSKIERTHALIQIAHPQLQNELIEQAKKLQLWSAAHGFDNVSQKIFYEGIGLLSKIKKRVSLRYWLQRVFK